MPNASLVIIRYWALVVCFALLASAIILQPLFFSHAPLSDDLSMIAFSREWSWEWLNKGLADYFIVYPEYYGPQSNFIRPVSNLSYWIFGAIFGSDYPFVANKVQLLVLTYGMLFAFSLLVGALTLKVQTSKLVAVLTILASLIIPTFWTTPSPTYTSFVFDGLAMTFCLLALYAVDRSRLLAMTLWLALAVMTKEIAVPVILGFTLAFIVTRNWRAISGCLIVIAVFVALRLNGFGLHAQGVYVFDSNMDTFLELVFGKLRNLFTLPFGPIFYDEIFTQTGITLLNRSGALLVMNSGLYLMIGWIFVQLGRRVNILTLRSLDWSVQQSNIRTQLLLISAFAATTSFAFDVYVGANYRYAFNFLPFLLIALAGIHMSAHAKRALFSIILIASLVASGPSIARFVRGTEYETFRYHVIRDFFETVRAHDTSKTIVVLNDIVLAYANPRAVEILAPTSSHIIRGTSLYLDNCSSYDFSKIHTRITRLGSEARVTVNLPECGRFVFESSPRLPEFASGNTILRNEKLHYEFLPAADTRYASVPGWDGRNLTMVIRDTDFLYFDFSDRKWKFVSASPP